MDALDIFAYYLLRINTIIRCSSVVWNVYYYSSRGNDLCNVEHHCSPDVSCSVVVDDEGDTKVVIVLLLALVEIVFVDIIAYTVGHFCFYVNGANYIRSEENQMRV